MRNLTLVLVLLAASLLVALLLSLRGPSAGGVAPSRPGPGAAGVAADREGAAGLARVAASDAARQAVPERAEASGARADVGPRTPRPESPAIDSLGNEAGEGGVEVRVVDGRTGAPVPYAELRFGRIGLSLGRLSARDDAPELDLGEMIEKFGSVVATATADAEGRARAPAAVTVVVATAGDRSGQALVGTSSRVPVTLRLHVERTLRVRTLDAAGRPAAGVPIVLRTAERERQLGTTAGPDARLEVLLPPLLDAERERPAATVVARVFGFSLPGVAVDLSAPPQSDLELVVPPFSTLDLHIFDAAGQPVRGARVDVGRAARLPGEAELRAYDGTLLLHPVGVGTRLEVHVATDTRSVRCEVAGPERPHRVAVRRIDLVGAVVELIGRALGSDGAACPFVRLRLSYRTDARRGAWATTDADGGFRFELPPAEAGRDLAFAEVQEVGDDGRLSWQSARLAPRPAPLQLGVQDVGVVRLAETPIPLTGRVSSPASPKSDLRMTVERQVDDGGDWVGVDGIGTVFVRPTEFQLRGQAPPGRLRLRVESRTCVPIEPIEFRAGDRDLLIQLERGADLAAVLVVPPGVTPVIGVQSDGGELRAPFSTRRTVDDVLECVWRGLRPGSYRLTVRTGPPADLLVFELPDIAVPAIGGTGGDGPGDPRLARIDLRDRF